MSDQPESLAAILAKARNKYTVHDCNECDYRKSCDLRFDCDECKTKRISISLALGIEDDYFTKLLDRIEAAAERGREINQKILAAANDANAILKDDRDRAIQFANAAPHPGSVSWKEMHEVYAKARAILSAVPKEGNAAAFREALEQAKRDHWFDMSPDLRNKIFAALSAPPEPPSNAAAMREALDGFLYWAKRMDEKGCSMREFVDFVREKTESALAAPARNCDLYATAEDAYAAWMVSPKLTPICEWLLAPAEGGAK